MQQQLDFLPPEASFSPADNATEVAVDSPLIITFDEAIQKGTGSIVIKKADGSVVETIDVMPDAPLGEDQSFALRGVAPSGVVTIESDGKTVTINPTNDLAPGTDYYVEIASGTFQDVAGNAYAGIASNETWNFMTKAATSQDMDAPTIASLTPVDNAIDINPASNLTLTFNEAVKLGNGTITIYQKLVGPIGLPPIETPVALINVTDSSQVSLSQDGLSVTINPTADLTDGDYFIRMTSGSFLDQADNSFAGISDNTTWNFSTKTATPPPPPPPLDTTPPTVVSFSPADNATSVALNSNLVLTFDEEVVLGVGTMYLRDDANNEIISINVDDAQQVTLSPDGRTLTINPTADLKADKDYSFYISSVAFKDKAGNALEEIDFTWNFTTKTATPPPTPPVVDTTAPTATFSPADNMTGVAVNSNLVLTFDEAIQKGTGNIVIKKVSDDSVAATIDVTSNQVVIGTEGKTVTIDPTNDLLTGTDYYIEIGNTVFQDKATTPNNFAGISGKTTWNFTTQIGIPVEPDGGIGGTPPNVPTPPPAPPAPPVPPVPPAPIPLVDPTTGQFNITTELLTLDEDTIDFGSNFKLLKGATSKRDNLKGTKQDDLIRGLGGKDTLSGSAGDDVVAGGNSKDVISGNDGNDLLFGGRGKDVIDAGKGDDILIGAMKADSLTGGAGKDTFGFRKLAERGDLITDFAVGETIVVLNSGFGGLLQADSAGVLVADQFVMGSRAKDANDYFLFSKKTGTLLFDADGNGGQKAQVLAELGAGANLSAQNITVI